MKHANPVVLAIAALLVTVAVAAWPHPAQAQSSELYPNSGGCAAPVQPGAEDYVAPAANPLRALLSRWVGYAPLTAGLPGWIDGGSAAAPARQAISQSGRARATASRARLAKARR